MDEIKKEEKKEVKPVEKKPAKKAESFINRKLAVINTMTNQAKARRLAERVLANKRKAGK